MARIAVLLLALFAVLSAPASANEPADAALAAFVLDFRQDGSHDPSGEVVRARYADACEKGYPLACVADEWMGTGELSRVGVPADESCTDGDPVACVVSGWALTQRRPGRVDLKSHTLDVGADRFRAACDAGLPRGCTDLALLELARSKEDPESAELALGRLKRACQAGEGRACHYVAERSKDAQRRVWWVEQGCTAKDPRSCGAYAARLRLGEGVLENDREALRLSMAACDGGFGEACTQAGGMIEYGEGIDEDPDRAVREYQRACRLADPAGCTWAGARLSRAAEDDELLARGIDYLQLGCRDGDGDGCWFLAERNLFGDPADHDLAEGLRWLRLGCEEGSDRACSALGQGEFLGAYGAADPAGGAATLTKACEDGGALSCTTLAHRVEAGAAEGDARKLLARACELESGRGCHAFARHLAGDEPLSSNHPNGQEVVDALYRGCRFSFRPSCEAIKGAERAVTRRNVELEDVGAREGLVTFEEAEFGPITGAAGLANVARALAKESAERPPVSAELRVATCALDFDLACLDLVTEQLQTLGGALIGARTTPLEEACTSGVGSACHLLGEMSGDVGAALERYEAGCSLGYGPSCMSAAAAHAGGKGVRRNRSTAALRFASACDAGTPVAAGCTRAWELASAGVKLGDSASHVQGLARICGPETPEACFRAAQALQLGDGVTRDTVRAVELAAVACTAGFSDACPGEGTAASSDLASGTPSVMGPLSVDVVQQIVISRAASYAACYSAALGRDPTVAGRVVMQIVASPTGQVAGAAVVESEVDDDDLLVCLQERMKELTFPAWTGSNPAIIAYPLELRPAE